MNIDFELYRVFYVVASNGNITKAAEELNISQPAISKSIKNLESQLGGQLFVRTKRGVVLTTEGKEFYHYISQAIEITRNAEARFTELVNLEVGEIRIGISTTLTKIFLIPYIKEFHDKYPHIDIKIITNVSSDLLLKLRNGLLDMVIVNSDNSSSFDDMELIKCSDIHDVFVSNKKIFNTPVSIEELEDYPLVLLPKSSKTREFLDRFASENGVNLKPTMELAGYSLIIEFTKIGFGIGCVPLEFVRKELENKELYKIDLKENIPNRFVGIVLSKSHMPSFSTKKLVEIITK